MSEYPIDDRLADDLDGLAAVASVRQLVAAAAVREIRESAGLTLDDIARVVGCTRSAVAHWEAGARSPSGDRAIRYAAALAECLRVTP